MILLFVSVYLWVVIVVQSRLKIKLIRRRLVTKTSAIDQLQTTVN